MPDGRGYAWSLLLLLLLPASQAGSVVKETVLSLPADGRHYLA